MKKKLKKKLTKLVIENLWVVVLFIIIAGCVVLFSNEEETVICENKDEVYNSFTKQCEKSTSTPIESIDDAEEAIVYEGVFVHNSSFNCRADGKMMTSSLYNLEITCFFFGSEPFNHCTNPLVMEFTDNNPLVSSLDGWSKRYYIPTELQCTFTKTGSKSVKLECLMPEPFRTQYCDQGITNFSVTARFALHATPQYVGCKAGSYAVGDKWCDTSLTWDCPSGISPPNELCVRATVAVANECIADEAQVGFSNAIKITPCELGQSCSEGVCGAVPPQAECTVDSDCTTVLCTGVTAKCESGICKTYGSCSECTMDFQCNKAIPSDCNNGEWSCDSGNCKLSCEPVIEPPVQEEGIIQWILALIQQIIAFFSSFLH